MKLNPVIRKWFEPGQPDFCRYEPAPGMDMSEVAAEMISVATQLGKIVSGRFNGHQLLVNGTMTIDDVFRQCEQRHSDAGGEYEAMLRRHGLDPGVPAVPKTPLVNAQVVYEFSVDPGMRALVIAAEDVLGRVSRTGIAHAIDYCGVRINVGPWASPNAVLDEIARARDWIRDNPRLHENGAMTVNVGTTAPAAIVPIDIDPSWRAAADFMEEAAKQMAIAYGLPPDAMDENLRRDIEEKLGVEQKTPKSPCGRGPDGIPAEDALGPDFGPFRVEPRHGLPIRAEVEGEPEWRAIVVARGRAVRAAIDEYCSRVRKLRVWPECSKNWSGQLEIMFPESRIKGAAPMLFPRLHCPRCDGRPGMPTRDYR